MVFWATVNEYGVWHLGTCAVRWNFGTNSWMDVDLGRWRWLGLTASDYANIYPLTCNIIWYAKKFVIGTYNTWEEICNPCLHTCQSHLLIQNERKDTQHTPFTLLQITHAIQAIHGMLSVHYHANSSSSKSFRLLCIGIWHSSKPNTVGDLRISQSESAIRYSSFKVIWYLIGMWRLWNMLQVSFMLNKGSPAWPKGWILCYVQIWTSLLLEVGILREKKIIKPP